MSPNAPVIIYTVQLSGETRIDPEPTFVVRLESSVRSRFEKKNEENRARTELGQTMQLLGNAGVIIGILLLVYELNQNRQMIEAQTRSELSQNITEMLISLSADSDVGDLMTRGYLGEALTDYESARFFRLNIAEFRYHENVHYQYRNGLYDEMEFAAQREIWRTTVFSRKGTVDTWCQVKNGFSPNFVAEVTPCSPPISANDRFPES